MRHAFASAASFAALALAFAASACSSPAPAGSVASSAAKLDTVSSTSPTSLVFSANGSYGASTPLVAGETVAVSYDPARAATAACVEEQNGTPVYGTTGYVQLNNGAVTTFYAAGLDPDPTAPSEFTIPAGTGGDLAVWFETTNVSGCHAWDSNFGTNFHFNVAPSADAPDWMGNADAVISRATCGNGPCDSDRHDLSGGFTFDTWARERAAITRVEFQVYKSGVTDHDNADLWKELDVEMHWRVGGTGAYATSYVDFEDRVGNNARYSFDLRSIDPLAGLNGSESALTSASQCPNFPLTTSADGMDVETTMDFWFTVNGADLRPASGGTFSGTYANYLGLYAVCVPPGGSAATKK